MIDDAQRPAAPALPARWTGAAVKRREDPKLITGQGTFIDDIDLPGMLHLAFVRSPHAHARIRGVDVGAALALPGVVACMAGEEAATLCPRLPPGAPFPAPPRRLLAVEKVRRVGEAVAAVLAEGRYLAADAVECVAVEYDELPAVIGPERALAPDAPQLWDDFPGNALVRDLPFGGGDVGAAFDQADVVVAQTIAAPRLAPSAIETRGVVAAFEPGTETLTCWSTTQVPHRVRAVLSELTGLPESRVHVIAPEVGGGFGAKGNVYGEEVLACFLAMRHRRPVKWVETRTEAFTGTAHGRGMTGHVELAARPDGTLTGLKLRITADIGHTCDLVSGVVPTTTARLAPNVYAVPAVEVTLTEVLTNKTPTGPYRGAGRPESVYFMERAMDLLARELAMDPAELRRRNFIPPDAFPHRTPTGLEYDSGEYAHALETLLETAKYARMREEQVAARAAGRLVGIGLACYVEVCGPGPSAQMGALGGWEYAGVRVERSGAVTALSGASAHGQGHETTFAQLIADVFGLDPARVHVLQGDTRLVPHGVGTFGSRSAAVGGAALLRAARTVEAKMRRFAADLLDAAEEDLVFADGRIAPVDALNRGLSFADVARHAYAPRRLPDGVDPGLEASVFFEPSGFTFPFGAYLCRVEVDRETGVVTLLDFVGIDDCGPVINPLIVAGQVHGGIAQGIGQALLEEVVYDESGQLVTGSFLDYAMPGAEQMPWLRLGHTVTPTPRNPLGMKGVGEAGTIGSVPAIVNAVHDALAPLGVRHLDMPLTPQRVWRAMREAAGNGLAAQGGA